LREGEEQRCGHGRVGGVGRGQLGEYVRYLLFACAVHALSAQQPLGVAGTDR
jgi:hypothetical protein